MSEAPISKVEREPKPAPEANFHGDVKAESIHVDEAKGVRQGRVHFHNGAHTHWHLHLGDQVLYFVAGKGIAQELGGEVIECAPGDIVHVPDGTRHIHGAAPGADATHLAITHGETIWDHDPRYPKD